ncbi:MAG: hypothetical protein R3B84_20290 [Zavarzinella sp.]
MAKASRPVNDRKPGKEDRRSRRDEEDDDEEEEVFVPKAKKRKTKTRQQIMMIIGAIAGSAALLYLIIWVYSPMGIDKPLLVYAPEEINSFVYADMIEMNKNTKMKPYLESILAWWQGGSNSTITVNNQQATGGFFKARAGSLFSSTQQQEPTKFAKKYFHCSVPPDEGDQDRLPQDRRSSITVITFLQDADTDGFIKALDDGFMKLQENKSPGGQAYYTAYVNFPVNGVLEPRYFSSFYFPNKSTLVYTDTKKEMDLLLDRDKTKISLKGVMREVADNCDGQFVRATRGHMRGVGQFNVGMSMGFVPDDVRGIYDPANPTLSKRVYIETAHAFWVASDSNRLLVAEASHYSDPKSKKAVKKLLSGAFGEAQEKMYSETKPDGLNNFLPKQPSFNSAPGAPPKLEPPKLTNQGDLNDALEYYAKSVDVYSNGPMVIVSGLLPHPSFDKVYPELKQFYEPQQNFGGFGGGFPGGPGGPAPMPGPGVPGGP